ncbi:Uncharacterised protein [Acinetobacter baumannii]|nr:Uncharacterised protein [Acinetobacter baumannii]
MTARAMIFSPRSTAGTTRSRTSGRAHLTTGGKPISSDPNPATKPPEPQRMSSSLAATLANRSPSQLPP